MGNLCMGERKKTYRSTFPSRQELAAQAEINLGVHLTLGVNLALVICFFICVQSHVISVL